MTDAQLIKATIEGDDSAFKKLVQRYEGMVAATVIGMLGCGDEAEDVGQETFIRFYKNLKQYRGEASLSTYLTRIAMNLSFNALKRRRLSRMKFWSVDDPVVQIRDTEDHEYDDTHDHVQNAVHKLPPEFRAVIVLRFYRERSIREISEILKIPQGTVLSRLARAQHKLRAILQPIMGDSHETVRTRPAV
ncbi:RNA polymerase sigma factor [bacterium]|nr:RNA polymerase sigma factor [bacterium]